jgi:hypothetical protein
MQNILLNGTGKFSATVTNSKPLASIFMYVNGIHIT